MDDLEFIQKCARGDKLAWDEFVDKYSNLIYRYIHSVLKFKGISLSSRETVDDLFQETFVSLTRDNFRKLKSYKAKNGCSLASWLRQVVINQAIDYTRKLKPVVASLDEELGDNFSLKDLIPDETPAASDTLVAKETIIHLTDCIQQLDIDDKYFLKLYIDKGLSLKELENILKVSRGAVDMRKSRIIDRLRDCFRSKGFQLDLL